MDILIDGILAALLIGTIVTSLYLNQRITSIRKGQQEMAGLVGQLGKATAEARASLRDLRAEGHSSHKTLENTVRKAQEISDELALIVQSGNSLADRLDQSLEETSDLLRRARPQANRSTEAGEQPTPERLKKTLAALADKFGDNGDILAGLEEDLEKNHSTKKKDRKAS